MSIWFVLAFIVLFLVSTSFFLFFNPATLRKPMIKMASHNEDKNKIDEKDEEK